MLTSLGSRFATRNSARSFTASTDTEDCCSNEDVAFLGYVWRGRGRERTAV